MLNFTESIDKLQPQNTEETKISEEDYERIKVLLNSKIEENKSVVEENDKFKIEISEWKKKLMQESQQNNEYVKGLISQLKDLQEKNFELQKSNLKLKKYDALSNTLKERNERIFKLEEKVKEMNDNSRKLKKNFLNKEIQLREDLEKEGFEKNKELSLKIDEFSETIKSLQQTIQRKDRLLDEKQDELMMMYNKMEEISNHIESKNVESVVKKLSKENSELIVDKANKDVMISNLTEKLKKKDETIANLESERDELFKRIVNYKRESYKAEVNQQQISVFSNEKENSKELEQMKKSQKSLELAFEKQGRK